MPRGRVSTELMIRSFCVMSRHVAAPSALDLAWRLAACGFGFGLFQSPNNHIIYTSAPLQRAGAASGMLGTARLTGQSLGAVLLGTIFSLGGVHDGAPLAIGIAALLAAASAGFSLSRLR